MISIFSTRRRRQIAMAIVASFAIATLMLINLRANNPKFGTRVDRGKIEHDSISEASGIAASRKNKDVLWLHNDSGKRARIFAINGKGRHLGSFQLQGIGLRDWEDIAVSTGPEPGETYIYVGDIGDNSAEYDVKYIHRIPEPEVDSAFSDRTLLIKRFDTIAFRYPDGMRDAETLMVDPSSRDIYLVSKREDHVRVYRAAYPQSLSEIITVEKVASIKLSGVVAGDISSSGRELLLKTYNKIFLWQKSDDQRWQDVLKSEPAVLPYILEPQGEAVCWDVATAGYFTTSEELARLPARLYYYPRVDSSIGDGEVFTERTN